MRRNVFLIVAALVLSVAFAIQARAQQPTFAMLGVNGCSGATPYGNASWCFDSVGTSNPGLWYNNNGTFTLVAGGGAGGLTPTFTSVTTGTLKATGVVDRTVTLSNDGHLNSQLGSGTIPTTSSCGTNTVTATSTDNAFQVAAGAVTACTVTFNTAYTAQPVCTCADNTTAAGLKVAHSTGVSITVSGLTSGDTFECICLGH